MKKYKLFLIGLLLLVIPNIAYAGFCGYLKADTTATLKLGPFVDNTDGDTVEDGLTIEDGDIMLSKNGSNLAQKNEVTDATIDELGYYDCPIDATDTNTEGRLKVICHMAGALMVVQTYMVVNANVFDSLYAVAATDYLQVDVEQYDGVAVVDTVAGIPDVNVTYWEDDAVPAATDGTPEVNVVEFGDTDMTETVAGLPDVNVTYWEDSAVSDGDGTPDVDATLISASATTANNIESVFLGTGHTDDVDLSMRNLKIESDTDVALQISSSDDSAIKATSTAATKHGLELAGNTSGSGLSATAGATGHGIYSVGGATSGDGIHAEASTEGDGIYALAKGTDEHGILAVGGDVSGDGIHANATAGDGHGMSLVKHGTGKDLDAEVTDDILADTDDIGIAGAGLTNIDLPDQTMDISGTITTATNVGTVNGLAGNVITAASINNGAIGAAEIANSAIDIATFAADVGTTVYADNAISLATRKTFDELNLDHLMKEAVANKQNMAEVVDNTVLSHLMTKTDGDMDDFDPTTDSLEALRDHVGDGTNLTEAGGTGDQLTAINLPNQTMDISGSLSGSVGSVTGAVGSVGADVGITQAGADKVWGTTARKLTHFDEDDVTIDLDGTTIGTVTTATTCTNLTNAPTVGDFTTTMKTSLDTAADTVTVTSMAVDVLTASALKADAVTEIIDNFETQSQADPTGFHVNVMEVNGTAQTANDNGADINSILIDTNELQTDDIPATLSTIAGYVDTEIGDLQTQIGAAGAGLSAIPWNASWDTEVESECTDALTTYDPPTKGELDTAQGAVTLANGAHGGAGASIVLADYTDFTGVAAENPNVLQSGTITVTDQTHFVLNAGSTDDDAYLNMVVVLEDTATAAQKSVRTITAYVGATKTVTIDSGPDFTIVTSDKFDILAIAPGSTPPTVGQIRTEMDANSTQLADIVEDTNELQTDWKDGGRLDLIQDIIAADTTTDIPGLIETVDANVDQIETAVITNAAGADIATDIIALKAETVLIVEDTNELQSDDYPTSIAAIKAETALIVEDTNALQTDTGNIQTDTEDIQSRLPAALSSGNIKADVLAISTSTEAADDLEASAETIVTVTAVAGTLSTTQMTTDLTEATDDHYNGRIIIWTSGVLKNQATAITDYDGSSKKLTYSEVTEAPTAGDTFNII